LQQIKTTPFLEKSDTRLQKRLPKAFKKQYQ